MVGIERRDPARAWGRSCNALVFSRKSLAKVASDFGFSDQSHFTWESRRLHGETPLAYRNRFK